MERAPIGLSPGEEIQAGASIDERVEAAALFLKRKLDAVVAGEEVLIGSRT
jgi:hypothetical protein